MTETKRSRRTTGIFFLFACLLATSPVVVAAQDVPLTAERVREAINGGIRFLKSRQGRDGTWDDISRFRGGSTALVTLAMLNAGLNENDPAVSRAIRKIQEVHEHQLSTYFVALRIMVLATADPAGRKYRLEIGQDARWLVDRQVKQGVYAGGWSYGQMPGAGGAGSADSSNSQFALLALHEAARIGIDIDPDVWKLAIKYWTNAAVRGGGFCYNVTQQNPTGSMTCAGISSLIIATENLADIKRHVRNGQIICCQDDPEMSLIEDGINWLARSFTVRGNPTGGGRGTANAQFYFLYGMERAGRLSGRRFFGPHDWYRAGAEQLLKQQNLNDSWQGRGIGDSDPVVATSFALLFLSKGKRPVAIGKLKVGLTHDWDRHAKGVHFLTRELESQWDVKLNWQTIQGDTATAQDMLEAPVLFLSGRDQLDLGEQQLNELKRYVEAGGFIFAEASQGDGCGDNVEFDRKLRSVLKRLFPDSELEPLQPDHPIWNAHFPLMPDADWPVLGLQACCRTSVVYVPRSLTCRWELDQPGLYRQLPAGPKKEVDYVTQLGVNVVAYATGRQLRDKLDVPRVADNRNEVVAERVLKIAKLSHSGGSDDAPNALRNVLARAAEIGLQVDPTKTIIAPRLEELVDFPLVFMHGRNRFRFSDQQREDLRTFLEAGGCLFADAICSSPSFAAAFRDEMNRIFPEYPLEPIPADDPIWDDDRYGGYDVRTVTISKPDRSVEGGFRKRRTPPLLEGIKIDGHYVVIFSPYDISCALENAIVSQCEGYTREDATRIAINVLLYALNRD